MSKSLKSISSNNKLDYYFDPKNIANQELVNETFDYFEKGAGKRAYKALDLLNLLDKQYNFIVNKINEPDIVVDTLNKLPLTEERKHILFGIILKWFGGYPVNNNEQFNLVLKPIQSKFLSHEGDTPEKEFCKADSALRNKLMKLGITGTTAINTGLDWKMLYDSIDEKKEKTYRSFDDLFNDFANKGHLGTFSNDTVRLIERSRLNYGFNVWLQNSKSWEYGNEDQYNLFLTKEIFEDYLMFEKSEKTKDIFLNNISSETAFRLFSENYSKLRERFRIKRKATKADCNEIHFLKEGDILEFEPEYKTSIEAFTLLTKYYAVAYLELEKHLFVEKYKVWNEHTINAEIKELDNFINEAKKLSLSEACAIYGKWEGNRWEYIYLRFTGGFYENLEVNQYPSINTIGNDEARVYGKYFLLYDLLKATLDSIKPPEVNIEKPKILSGKSRLDFTKDRLKITVLELANLNGYEKPSSYLDELLVAVKQFDDFDFECSFVLNIHYLCKENADKFWSEAHRKDITMWLKKAHIVTDVFDTTWETQLVQEYDIKPTITAYAIMHVYLAMFNGQAVTQQNKNELVKKYGYNSGNQLRNDFTLFQSEQKRMDLNTTNKRSANTHLLRYKVIIPLLEKENDLAYQKAKSDLTELEKIYNRYF